MKNIFVQCHGKFTVEVSQGTPSKKKKEKKRKKKKKEKERSVKREAQREEKV